MKKRIPVILLLLLAMSLPASAAKGDVYLSDIKNNMTGYSCLEDTVGIDTSHAGDKITIGSSEYKKGLGAHCNPADPTYIEFDISGYDYKYLTAYIGMQSYSAAGVFLDWASAVFCVYGDGKVLYTSDVLKYKDEPVPITVDISGVEKLRLEMSNAGGYSCDWCVWGDVKMTNEPDMKEITTTEKLETENRPQTDDVKNAPFAYISDTVWGEYKNYSGSEPIRDGNHYNEEIWKNGTFYEKGVGMHADSGGSYIEVNLEGCDFKKFFALCGISDSLSPHDITMASVKFIVYGDGKELVSTDTVRYGDEFVPVTADITGVKILRLMIDPTSDGISGDWGTWVSALVSKTDELPPVAETTAEPPAEATSAPKEDTTASAGTETKAITPKVTDGAGQNGKKSALPYYIAGGVAALAAICFIVAQVIKKGKKK